MQTIYFVVNDKKLLNLHFAVKARMYCGYPLNPYVVKARMYCGYPFNPYVVNFFHTAALYMYALLHSFIDFVSCVMLVCIWYKIVR